MCVCCVYAYKENVLIATFYTIQTIHSHFQVACLWEERIEWQTMAWKRANCMKEWERTQFNVILFHVFNYIQNMVLSTLWFIQRLYFL